jgi:DNA-binding MarR family transcriptional regulator
MSTPAGAVVQPRTMAQLKRAERRYHLLTRDYARLAGFRRALRTFLRFSDDAAAAVGLTGQHYQAMLVVRACPDEQRVTIADLAQQLLIKHNSAVELVDRLAELDLLAREASSKDRRKVELRLTVRGRNLLAKLAAMHRAELQRIGPELERFFASLSKEAG